MYVALLMLRYSIWINIIIILPSCCIVFFVIRCIRRYVFEVFVLMYFRPCYAQLFHRYRHRGGAAEGGFWNRDMFEMSYFQRSSPPLPLVPLVLSVFLLEDDEGEPGVCEIAVAIHPVESSVLSTSSFYNDCRAADVLRQA